MRVARYLSHIEGTVSFKFQKSSCVAAGTFNIYIIQPKWLSEVDILPNGKKFRMEADLKRPGFKISSPDIPSEWHVRPDRLQVNSSEFHEDCGDKVAKVLEILKWTPLQGVGINTEFSADPSILEHLPKVQIVEDIAFPPDYELVQKAWHRTLERNGAAFNLQLSATKDAVLLALNVHTELSHIESHKEATEIGERACREFFKRREEIIELASNALRQELIHADDDGQ